MMAGWIIGHGGWSALGWREEDPDPEEAMAALASMGRLPTGPQPAANGTGPQPEVSV